MKNQETCFVLDTNLIANELFDSIHLSIESLIEYLRGYMSYSLYPVEIECIITVVEKQLKETGEVTLYYQCGTDIGFRDRISVKEISFLLAGKLEQHQCDAIPVVTFENGRFEIN